MSKPFDYSKWDNIELSDDEDDVHPNIDRESWFRLKHRSRVEREEREEADKKRIREETAAADLRMKEIDRILSKLNNKSSEAVKKSSNSDKGDDSSDDDDDELEDREGLEAELAELQKANKARQDKLDEYERNKKWNVDNMCRVVEERTIINPRAAEQKFSSTGYALPEDTDIGSISLDDNKKKGLSREKQTGTAKKKDSAGATTAAAATEEGSSAGRKKSSVAASTVPATTAPAASSTATRPKKAPTTTPSTSADKETVGPDRESIAMLSYHDFTEKYADVVEEFMKLRSFDKTKEFLLLHGDVLLQENASNYLLLASLEDEMNGFHDKMRLTARQSQVISNIAELAKSLRTHPGNVIVPFFEKLEKKEFLGGFLEGVETFIERIKNRAVQKKKEMAAEAAAEAQEAGEAVDITSLPPEERLGPGGLDPAEVFESLPLAMQEAFESRDVEQLKEALMQLEPSEAEYHMKRCVDSGLWNE